MSQILIGCSGWNYGDSVEKGGWVGSFYPDVQTKRLRYYSEFFRTAELDASFYDKFYSKMTSGTFYGMVKATPTEFQFSVKVPETVTHTKRMDVKRGAMETFQEFLEKISPLKTANKLGAILLQLPPSFSVNEFKQVEKFLNKMPSGYDYALEFRHASWQTEGPWEMLKHYNVGAVMTDSPDPKLNYLSDIKLTADHSFIRFHGRNEGYWYNYLYSEEELRPWTEKVNKMAKDPEMKRLRIYFNNHYGGKAVVNAIQFKEMIQSKKPSEKERDAKQKILRALSNAATQKKLSE
ncbi:MAG: DUF72 domain-containing protein [Thermoproteota archaeon]|nr:DUF72 domain-containing protein [Thermoproteota archaeon]